MNLDYFSRSGTAGVFCEYAKHMSIEFRSRVTMVFEEIKGGKYCKAGIRAWCKCAYFIYPKICPVRGWSCCLHMFKFVLRMEYKLSDILGNCNDYAR